MLDPKKIRLIVIVTILTLIGALIFYVGTHGRIVIKNPGDKSLSIVMINKDGTRTDPTDITNGAAVSSGEYVVKNRLNGSDRLAYISVPGWFGSTGVAYSSIPTAKTTRLAAFTYEHFFPADNGSFVSYSDLNSYMTGYTTHPAGDAFGGNYTDTGFSDEFTSPVVRRDGQLIGIHEDGTLVQYSFKTTAMETVGGITLGIPGRDKAEDDVTTIPKIRLSSDADSSRIGVYEKTKQTLKTIDTSGKVTSYPATTTNKRGIVFDTNETAWAIIETSSNISDDGSPEDEDTFLNYTIAVHNTSTNKVDKLSVNNAKTVSDIAVSPSGKFVAVLRDGELWVYEVSSKRVVMVHPFTITNRVFWNKNKLYSLSSDAGINVFDTNTLQLLPVGINSKDSLSFSDFTPFGSKLYVTAYNTKQDSKLPDGYVVDLDKSSDGVTEELAAKLPVENDNYDINYLESTIFVRINLYNRGAEDAAYLNGVASIKAAAERKIRSLVRDDILKKCTIVYDK